MKNYYDILELHPCASVEDIKASYKRLAMLFHPDHNSSTTEQFKEIKEAYELLSDRGKRKRYDLLSGAVMEKLNFQEKEKTFSIKIEKKGLDTFAKIPITPAEAILGAEIEIPTADGNIAVVRIPDDIAKNMAQKFPLAGLGLENKKTGQRGDYIISFKLVLPSSLSMREKLLYKELLSLQNSNPRVR